MRFQFLGTSAGIPTKERNVTGLAVQLAGSEAQKSADWVLVDCGEGTQHQLLHTAFSLNQLAAICITHCHGDHCFGLPGLLASCSMFGRKHPLKLIAPEKVIDWVERSLAATDSFLSYDIESTPLETLGTHRVEVSGGTIKAYPLSHRVPSWGFRIEHQRQERRLNQSALEQAGVEPGPLWGQLMREDRVVTAAGTVLNASDFRIESVDHNVLVVGGDNDTPECLLEACHGAHALIHEATYTQAIADKVGVAPMHTSSKQIAIFAERIQIPALILTHISSRYPGKSVDAVQYEAIAHYQGRLAIAADFDAYALQKGVLTALSGSSLNLG